MSIPQNIEDVTYWTAALTLAGGFYGLCTTIGAAHLSTEKKSQLTAWLKGDFESTWLKQLNDVFDVIFSPKHLSWKCFYRSAIFSVLSVVLLYWIFEGLLGLYGENNRIGSQIDFYKIVGIAVLLNILPDYVSLLETRVLIRLFQRYNSIYAQALLLTLDLVLTSVIIYCAINAYTLLSEGQVVSLMKLVAVFSPLSVLFYSTFVTSVWAWIFFLSTWLMRFFAQTSIKNYLDIEGKPLAQIGLVGAAFIMLASLLLSSILQTPPDKIFTRFDDFACWASPDTCVDLSRLSKDDQVALHYLTLACFGGESDQCVDAGVKYFENDPQTAADLWIRACDEGHGDSCGSVGHLFHDKKYGIYDPVRAEKYLINACELSSALGCTNLAVFYSSPDVKPNRPEDAKKLFLESCEAGYKTGCHNYADILFNSKNKDDQKQAIEILENNCVEGYNRSCSTLGFAYEKGIGTFTSVSVATKIYRLSCDYDDAQGCNNLGVIYLRGEGVAKDVKKARDLFAKACEAGNMMGCTNLASGYIEGSGVSRDTDKAIDLLNKACNKNYASACTNLGVLYRNGDGKHQNTVLAMELLSKGCDAGNALGCRHLADMHYYGEGTDKNLTIATDLYWKICSDDEQLGCSYLSHQYRKGEGVKKNMRKAFELMERSCKGGYADGCYDLSLYYKRAIGTHKSESGTKWSLSDACKLDANKYCYKAGKAFVSKGRASSDKLAHRYFTMGCKAGDQRACDAKTSMTLTAKSKG